jgi:hypothetical protein
LKGEKMHTLQFIAVEAENKEDAFQMVLSTLEENPPSWSDWHVVGGGRWGLDEFPEANTNSYENTKETVISFIEEPEVFNKYINITKEQRKAEVKKYAEDLESKTTRMESAVAEFIENSEVVTEDHLFDMGLWQLSKLVKMLQGEWTYDSAFFDMTYYNSGYKALEERLAEPEVAKLQYLVPVDFHF